MIETERLLLREYTIDDFDALYEIMSEHVSCTLLTDLISFSRVRFGHLFPGTCVKTVFNMSSEHGIGNKDRKYDNNNQRHPERFCRHTGRR